MFLSITDAANHVPVFHEFMVLPAMIYDALVLGTDRLDTNVTHITDQSQTARDIGASVLLANAQGFKKNTAFSNFTFPMYDTNGALATGLTVSAERRLDSGAFAACANSVSEVSDGYYSINFDASDLNGDFATIRFFADGAQESSLSIRLVQA
jgi:hypothetical protein